MPIYSEKWIYPDSDSRLDSCPWCGKSENLDTLEICSLFRKVEAGWLISYPGEGAVVVFVSHFGCGPDEVTYWIRLKDVISDPDGWRRHLRGKIWNCLSIMWAIDDIAKKHKRPKKSSELKPRTDDAKTDQLTAVLVDLTKTASKSKKVLPSKDAKEIFDL